MWVGFVAVCSILTLQNPGDKCKLEDSPYAVYTDPLFHTKSECIEEMIDFALKDGRTMRIRLTDLPLIYKIQIWCVPEIKKAAGSFNGRTGVFEAPHVGSIPTLASNNGGGTIGVQ